MGGVKDYLLEKGVRFVSDEIHCSKVIERCKSYRSGSPEKHKQ